MFSLSRHFSTSPRVLYRVKKQIQDVAEQPPKPKRGRPPKTSLPSFDPPPVQSTLGPSRPELRDITNPTSKVNLPPPSEWRTRFPPSNILVRDRVSLSNPATAAHLAEAFVPKKAQGKVVIEAFPGPGALTRALLQLPKERIKKLIVLEDYEPYLEYLKPLEALDPRVQVVPMEGFSWDTYQVIEDSGILSDIDPVPWENGVHPQLHFISHLRHNIMGEQLIAQLFRCIPEQSWLFKYGRVPMSFILSEWVWQRISATPLSLSLRCKLSVIAEATASSALALPAASLDPYDAHFHPTTVRGPHWADRPETRRAGSPFVAVGVTPRAEQVIDKGMLDKWDYCLRRLFVLKGTPLKSAISHLAPGASTLLKPLSAAGIDVKKQVRKLSVQEWKEVLKAFDEWPFAPEDLMITDSFSRDDRNGG